MTKADFIQGCTSDLAVELIGRAIQRMAETKVEEDVDVLIGHSVTLAEKLWAELEKRGHVDDETEVP